MARACQGPGELNDGVGAEHVQKTRTPPAGFSALADAGLRLASVDGDADRLVYHYFDTKVRAGRGVSMVIAPMNCFRSCAPCSDRQ
jgi:hypothetical protein